VSFLCCCVLSFLRGPCHRPRVRTFFGRRLRSERRRSSGQAGHSIGLRVVTGLGELEIIDPASVVRRKARDHAKRCSGPSRARLGGDDDGNFRQKKAPRSVAAGVKNSSSVKFGACSRRNVRTEARITQNRAYDESRSGFFRFHRFVDSGYRTRSLRHGPSAS